MWENAKTVALTSSSAIIQLDVDENFIVNTTHLNMIRENNFDGYLRADPHDYIREFLAIYDIFKYGEPEKLNNDVRNDLEDFKRCVRSMRTVHQKLFVRDDDEWSKSQNVSSKQTDRTDPPPPPPQSHNEQVNVISNGREKSDDSSKIQTPPPIIVNNKIEKDRLIKTSKKNYCVVETKEYLFPLWENAMTVAPTPSFAIIQLDVDDNFVVNTTHLNMIRENKFDCYRRADPHDYIREFLAICDIFKYGETKSEAVKLLIFPFSLCDEAKTWFNELNEESKTSWKQIRRALINIIFPPSLFNRLLLEIRNFSQLVCESLIDAWLRLKSMLRKCQGHGLAKGAIIQIFYHGLDEPTQGILDVTARGIFLYKSPNQAFQFLEDEVLFNLDWFIKSQNDHHQKSISFTD
nr:reverse transcriptase domain-containing protein [Tanacetum cinerariifolium]